MMIKRCLPEIYTEDDLFYFFSILKINRKSYHFASFLVTTDVSNIILNSKMTTKK